MHRFVRLLAAIVLMAVIGSSFADRGTMYMSAWPTMSVADGHSTVQLDAEIRDASGHLAPDGTRVLFNADPQGSFRDNIVLTTNGHARAILIAGGTAGATTVTATALTGDYQPGTLEYVFVGSRAELSSQFEYVELVAPGRGFMQYCAENRIIEASGWTDPALKDAKEEPVSIKYREISIRAEDVQYNIPGYEIRARRAIVKIGKGPERKFSRIYLKLSQRTGYGMTTFMATKQIGVTTTGRDYEFVTEGEDGNMRLVTKDDWSQKQERFGLVEIKGQEIVPAKSNSGASLFEFEDTSGSISTIAAKKALVFPNKEIQFQRAEVMVGGSKVLRMPLYELSLLQGGSIVMNNLVSVQNSQLSVNYPYYLSLQPGMTSMLRLQTGNSYGGYGVTSDHGVYLGYELDWNRGDDMQGGANFTGIGRNDWSLGANQFWKIDDRTTASGQFQLPQGSAVFGSASLARQFNGFETSLSGSDAHNFRGIPYNTEDYEFVAEKDPIKMGKLPAQMYLGVTALDSTNSLIGSSQQGAGVRMRLQSNVLKIDKYNSFTTSATISQLTGQNTASGLSTMANATLVHRFTSGASVVLTYDFLNDGYNDRFLGHNRFGLQTSFSKGNLYFSLIGNKSIDVEQSSLYADLKLSITRNWVIGYGYTFDRYTGTTSLDYDYILGYRIGIADMGREIGLVWSHSTGRIGIELLGATF